MESDEGKLLWDFTIQSDHVIKRRRTDTVFLDKQQGQCHIIDIQRYVAVPGDARIKEKEEEKLEKYQDLRKINSREVFHLWCVNVMKANTGWGFGYGDEELTKESSANTSDCKNGISAESGIAWNCKNFAKSS